MAHSLRSLFLLVCLAALGLTLRAQTPAAPATLTGTVVTEESNIITSAAVQLCNDTCVTTHANDDGFFQLQQLAPGDYTLRITANGFDPLEQKVTLAAGQFLTLSSVEMKLNEVRESVTAVAPNQAAEELRAEEKQNVLGIIPNFYVAFGEHPAPLSTSQKYQLATKTLLNPFTVIYAAASAGIQQNNGTYAGDLRPNGTYTGWGYGAPAYGKIFAANIADQVSGTFLGNAIFPSLFHQDPRYFYRGKGSFKSRLLHALSSSIICPGDNGHLQPNYSFIAGNFTAAGLSNAYYPAPNRGVGLTLTNAALNTVAASAGAVVQEFFLGKLTTRHKK